MTPVEPDRYLGGQLALVERQVRRLVEQRRATDPNPDDPFRGLYVTDDDVDRILDSGVREYPTPVSAAGHRLDETSVRRGAAGSGLGELAARAALTGLDVDLLLIALIPDLDSRFERLYGYLNDDVTRRRASIGLALDVAGANAVSAADRGRLAAPGPLVDQGLVIVEDADRPFLTRSLRVPDRVAAHLLGDATPASALLPMLVSGPPFASPESDGIARAMGAGVTLVHVREREPGSGVACAVAALHETDRPALIVDLELLARSEDPRDLAVVAGREALLRGAGLVAGPVEALAEDAREALHRLCEWSVPVLLVGAATWDPRWSRRAPLTVEAPTLGARDRAELMRRGLDAVGADFSQESVSAHLSLGPGQVYEAVRAAQASAHMHGGSLTPADLRRGVRAQNSAGLERLARRIEPEVDWDDLVLAPGVMRALKELSARARHRDTVLVDWRMRRGGGRGRGVIALFAGDSGTGKTMSAEVIAADLGLDLYTVNLATVVDKYVGETEKNLERIFTEATGVNAVLFFDEADAIFGKRSEVRDAHDRYANVESAYLLQRLETFDGLAILATNLRANIDEAFTRRLDSIIDFPAPTSELRTELWRHCLAPPLPLGPDVDLEFCAQSFELTGGNIRSASITAAYLAAESGEPVTMADVITAVGQEYRKLGRLVHEREFGDYLAVLSTRGVTGSRA